MVVKLHFSTVYDAFKYDFRAPKGVKYSNRKDKLYFNKLARSKYPKELVIANLSIRPNLWVGKLFEQKAQDQCWKWMKYQQSQTYTFKEEINQLEPTAFTYFVSSSEHPEALKMFLRGRMSLDTLAIANDFFRMTTRWDQGGLNDPVWIEVRQQIVKYRPFIEYNRESILGVLKEKFLTYHT